MCDKIVIVNNYGRNNMGFSLKNWITSSEEDVFSNPDNSVSDSYYNVKPEEALAEMMEIRK